jgi:3-deoxy-D-arabino-heptulosonate 7-phosphate (DAHP) synthase class II
MTIDLTARCARYEEALQMIAKGDSDPTTLALLAYAALHNQPPVETAVERKIHTLRDALAQVVGAFTNGVYCGNCGESVDDCDCFVNDARAVLAE